MGIMQSDPNPANFTYNQKLNQLNLFDFGATHIYKEEFLNNYCDIIEASIAEDRQKIIQKSIEIGFLTKD
jgi:aarF domain-containing kinase